MVEGILVSDGTRTDREPIRCGLCGETRAPIARAIGVCGPCIRKHPERALAIVRARRRDLRLGPPMRPDRKAPQRTDRNGIVAFGFYDDHPANCIAAWQCPATTGVGYPRFARCQGPELGCRNLAIFSAGCNFDCPFCQDWIHQAMARSGSPWFSDDEVLAWVTPDTTCVSFCGGTPDVQMTDVLRLARKFRRRYVGRLLRICAETNLTAPARQLVPFAREVLDSGGGLNIGLKAGTDPMHKALTGASNRKVWANLALLQQAFGIGRVVPFLRPSLLVIPGYVDDEEVRVVARRLADMDKGFTLKLIAFLPRFRMDDLPATQDQELLRLAEVARQEGLERVSPTPGELDGSGRFVRTGSCGLVPNRTV